MLTVVYIVGVGRSGSTVLDIILGQSQYIFSCGELSNLSNVVCCQLPCSCGEVLNKCEFWASIISSVRLFSPICETKLNHPGKTIAWLGLFRMGDQKLYVDYLDDIYEKISIKSKCIFIVDSSKSPVRLAALMKWSRHHIKAIHLLRDPIDISDSLEKTIKANPSCGVQKTLIGRAKWRSYLLWLTVNFLTEVVLLFLPRSRKHRIRYEDLLANPDSVYGDLCDFLGVKKDIQSLKKQVLTVSHIMAGNRMRMSPVQLIACQSYNQRIRNPASFFGELISFFLRIKYGYSRINFWKSRY